MFDLKTHRREWILALAAEMHKPQPHGFAGAIAAANATQTDPEFCAALDKIQRDVLWGMSLSKAMSRFPAYFDKEYVDIMRQGEAGWHGDGAGYFDALRRLAVLDAPALGKVNDTKKPRGEWALALLTALQNPAGCTFDQALAVANATQSELEFRKALDKIMIDVLRGVRLSDALAKWPAYFDAAYVDILRHGEAEYIDALKKMLDWDAPVVKQ